METRSRKRAQAFEQAQSLPERENKKPNMSSTTSGADISTTQHRYPTRKSSRIPSETSHMNQDVVSKQSRRSKMKIQTEINIDNGISQQYRTDSSQVDESSRKSAEKGKEKEIQLDYRKKGKDKQAIPAQGPEKVHHPHGTVRVDKSHYIYLGGSYDNNTLVNILSNIKSGNETMQIDGLTKLCEVLCMGNESTLSNVPVNAFATELIKILNNDNPELMLLAARAITQLCEMIPTSCGVLVNQGAVPYFCGILQSIQYIDVAEQSLQALFKISRDHPGPCLRAGGLMAVLGNFDFYSTGVQRVAVSTAANMCKRMTPDAFNHVNEALPILTNLLEYPDFKVVEHSSVCLIRIAESFATSWEKLDILCMHGLISAAIRLLSVEHTAGSQTSLSDSTYTGLLRLLSICASGSSVAAESLLEMNISNVLKDILSSSNQSVLSTVMNMPSQQLSEIVALINVLLPPTPQSLVHASIPSNDVRVHNSTGTKRKQPLCDQPTLLAQFATDLFPVLIQVYGASLNATVRSTCMDAIRKLVYFSTPDLLWSIFQELNISSFLVAVLTSKVIAAQVAALQIADLLMQKLRDHFGKVFIKEGVLHTISTQFGLGLANTSSPGERSKRRSKKVCSVATELEIMKAENATHISTAPLAYLRKDMKDIMSIPVGLAQKFKDMYFRSCSGTSETATFKKLKKLCSILSTELKGTGGNGSIFSANDEKIRATLAEILAELGKGNSVSTFEFVGCGVIESLLQYFSCSNQQGKIPLSELRQKALERLQEFFEVSLSCSSKSTEPLLTSIVRKLQSALASLESFPVKLSRQFVEKNNSGQIVGLNALVHPIKLQLCKSSAEKNLKDYPPTILLVNPLLPLSSVEHYLWPHVRNPDLHGLAASPSTSAHASMNSSFLARSKSDASVSERLEEFNNLANINVKLATAKVKGKEKLDLTHEHRGPETRSATQRKRQAAAVSVQLEAHIDMEDVGAELYGSEDDIYSTDEDDFYSDDERDDHGQVRLVSEEESIVSDVYEVLLEDDTKGQAADDRLLKRATGSSSTNGRGISEDGLESCVVVPGAASLTAPARLSFSVGGKLCDRSWTVFKAITNPVASTGVDDERFRGLCYDRWFLDKLHVLSYQQAEPGIHIQAPLANTSALRHGKRSSVSDVTDRIHQTSSFLDRIVQKQLPCDMDESSPTYNILLMLYILEGLNRLAPRFRAASGHERQILEHPIPSEEFISSKLMPKMIRQMQDAMALCSGNLPSWCHQLVKACPFLFSFECRRQYFYLTSFGLQRALHRLQQQQIGNNMTSANDRDTRLNRLQRRKVRISRDRIFESAGKVMDLFSKDKGVLEVEYFGEVGTGLGPTLEFYTLLSRDLQKVSLGMWRNSPAVDHTNDGIQDGNDLASSPFGLFPQPLPQSSPNYGTVLKHFRLLGQVVGKALQDGRLLDLPLSKLFYKLILDQDLDLYDVKFIDFELGTSLEQMHKLVTKKLQGYPDYILKPGGDKIMVDSENLGEYISLVVDASVKSGVLSQLDAFRTGFNQVFPISTLQTFNEEELSYMICGHRELWQPESLMEHLRFDHGYNASSPPIKYLLEIMGEFNAEQQRAFLQFVTGAPQLPCGGLSALQPKLTIVRKLPSGISKDASPGAYASLVDRDLPSVMTCANYLKLPPYSCKEVMWERLLYAIKEGQGSFDLS
ncbi:hypothetical protein KP509_02G085400 [Ceratopteris richardii]|uniref:HECT-type E3 ubiquitin transferase n=1 Tax=Ceratopteris richardii TaxID=49495 RepID=A0A8T2V849_CERRI|nr:hypothetical protein KP509_02G085400 [Ceratopteris richardii]